MVSTISPQELLRLHQSGKTIELIDVRTPAEFREVHVEFARSLPLDRLDAEAIAKQRAGRGDETLYVICRSGGRGKQACEKLLAAGITNVVNVEGGTSACEVSGVPVVRGKKTISLERQVRIAAGLLVFTGAVLGYFVHPYWIGLAAFVGAGLVFAGVTDTCGMGMLLARMPWNQVSDKNGAACRTATLLFVLSVLFSNVGIAAEHTRDDLMTVKKAVAEKKAVLLDVRELSEWNRGHLQDARLLSLSELSGEVRPDDIAKVLPKDKVIYAHCAAGGRCLNAADILRKYGYDVRPLRPGYVDLLKAGFAPAPR